MGKSIPPWEAVIQLHQSPQTKAEQHVGAWALGYFAAEKHIKRLTISNASAWHRQLDCPFIAEKEKERAFFMGVLSFLDLLRADLTE